MDDSSIINAKFATWFNDAITIDSSGTKRCAVEYLARQHVQDCVDIMYVAHVKGRCVINVRSASDSCHVGHGWFCVV